ncbi:uncharacterized protein LOC125854160 [Solanum stenotomum]|uniref:uncharacterized protein LOC125854160 n=1 Tax=Solanum stenotomum TaxID=172797 RepID=UPI0020CFFA05|nr:uncharacterized protein LOC125854160 [Solanum stenotomum]
MASRLRDFVRMNPPVFLGSMVGENHQEFLDELCKIVNAMGMNSREKPELASYQLKDDAQVWFTQWKSSRPVGASPIDWEEFKKEFLGRFFPREKREVKREEFINLKQGSMSVQEYFLKFTQLYKYALSLVSNPRDEMSRFVTGESNLKRKNKELKRSRYNEQGQLRFKRRDPNQNSSNTSKFNKEKGGGPQFSKPACTTCGKRHYGKCLAGTNGCYGCRKNDHKVNDFPTLAAKEREAKQDSLNDPDPNAPKRNRFYMLQANKDKRAHPD